MIPEEINLGENLNTPIASLIETTSRQGSWLFGFTLPDWQRPFVWSQAQCEALITSLWRGIPIGTYAYVCRYGSPFDCFLIDGQQRITAVHKYMAGEFPMFGAFYPDLPRHLQRRFEYCHFPCYRIRGKEAHDERFLREYYTLMNFGGTAHTEDQRPIIK